MAAGTACFLRPRTASGPSTGKGLSLEEAFVIERKRLEESLSRHNGDATMEGILSAHLEILDDPMLREAIDARLSQGKDEVSAVRAAREDLCDMFEGIGDEYLRARADDVRDICNCLEKSLLGEDKAIQELPEDAIIVADELFPSDTAAMDFSRVRALVMRRGSITSHVAIIARSKGIPALMGIEIDGISPGDRLLVNGNEGLLTVRPEAGKETAFLKLCESSRTGAVTEKLCRRDGSPVRICANAASLMDIDEAIAAGADGIGLFRTEFVFMDSDHLPTEDEQVAVYREAVRRCQGKQLIIRTLDIGGDKALPYLSMPEEENPFLGTRGIRLCLAHEEVFRPQIRAILRAAASGNVLIMVPMVSTEGELDSVLRLVRECSEELSAEGVSHGAELPVGIMVETPAAVFSAHELARKAAFFSIGTNDLTQYVMAADRGNPGLARLNDALDPAVRKAIAMTVEAGHAAGIPVGVCGEMASSTEGRAFLAETGVDSVSLSSPVQIRKLTSLS